LTGTGSQPVNFDVFAGQYNRYRVLSSRIAVQPLSSSAKYDFCVLPSNNSTTISFEESCAQPYVKVQNNVQDIVQQPVLSTNMRSAKILGRTELEFRGSDLNAAVVNTSPSEIWIWELIGVASDRTSTVNAIAEVKVYYDVEFYDRIPQVLSLEHKKGLRKPWTNADRGKTLISDAGDGKKERKETEEEGDYVSLTRRELDVEVSAQRKFWDEPNRFAAGFHPHSKVELSTRAQHQSGGTTIAARAQSLK